MKVLTIKKNSFKKLLIVLNREGSKVINFFLDERLNIVENLCCEALSEFQLVKCQVENST